MVSSALPNLFCSVYRKIGGNASSFTNREKAVWNFRLFFAPAGGIMGPSKDGFRGNGSQKRR